MVISDVQFYSISIFEHSFASQLSSLQVYPSHNASLIFVHISFTRSGFRICKVIFTMLSSTVSKTRCCVSAIVSSPSRTGDTLWERKRRATVATNSTCNQQIISTQVLCSEGQRRLKAKGGDYLREFLPRTNPRSPGPWEECAGGRSVHLLFPTSSILATFFLRVHDPAIWPPN